MGDKEDKIKEERTMRNLVQNIVAISVAIVVFTAILIPVMGYAEEQTIDGEKHTANNTAPAVYLDVYKGTEAITIDYRAEGPTVTTSIEGLTTAITGNIMVSISGTAVTVTDATGTSTLSADRTITIPATNRVYVNTPSTTSATATYGLYTSFSTPLYVEGPRSMIVMDTASPYIAVENCKGTAIPMTSSPYEGHDDIYGITSVGTNGKLVAPIEYVWYDQIPAMDDTIKTILDILPLLIMVGILMTCVYMFFNSRNSF